MPRPKTFPIECYVSLPGGAGHVSTLAGAAAGIAARRKVLGWSGVSAGFLVAMAHAFGVPPSTLRRLLIHVMQDNRLLDVAPLELGDMGLCGGHIIPRLIKELVGEKTTMGDSPVPLMAAVGDLTDKKVRYFSKHETPHALVWEVGAATSAFPFVFPQVPITSVFPDRRLFTDGGTCDNTTDAVWDEERVPRIAVRLVEGAPVTPSKPVVAGDPLRQSLALVACLTSAAERYISKRDDGLIIDVKKIGDGMDFSVPEKETRARWVQGWSDATTALKPYASLQPST